MLPQHFIGDVFMSNIHEAIASYSQIYGKLGRLAVRPYTCDFFYVEPLQGADSAAYDDGRFSDIVFKSVLTLIPVLPVFTVLTSALALVTAVFAAITHLFLLAGSSWNDLGTSEDVIQPSI